MSEDPIDPFWEFYYETGIDPTGGELDTGEEELIEDEEPCGSLVMDDVRKRVLESTQISEFQRKVYLELLNIPKGTTISYGELGRRIGCRSARAIGQALHRNPFAPDVPCHRVIKSDGSLGGYAFGVEKKAELLKKESSERQDEGRHSEGE